MRQPTSFILAGILALAARDGAECRPSPASPRFGGGGGVGVGSALASRRPDAQQRRPAPWSVVPRGGATDGTSSGIVTSLASDLSSYMKGAKSDALVLLGTTALVAPACNKLGISSILGFLAAGMAMGPNGIKGGAISDVHSAEMLAELGIVFFLFEMGLHIDFDTLMDMKADVFGLGLAQVVVTAGVVGAIAKFFCGMTSAASVVLGGGAALSSSAFVLQLLKDKKVLDARHGKASLGVLIFQDLAVVPLLVVTPLLAGGGNMGKAFASAGVAFVAAVSALAVCAKFVFGPLFDAVASSQSQEAFVGLVLAIVLGLSFLTEGLGLSNTLGPFASGMILASSKHRSKIEAEVSPFRGVLVGLFFFSVGFEIDLNLIKAQFGTIAALVLGIMTLKAGIIAALCLLFGIDAPDAARAGLLLSEVSEFAFVAFRTARAHGIFDADVTKLLLTAVSLTMALTPFAEELGGKFAARLEGKTKKE